MKKTILILFAALLLAGCGTNKEEQLRERAAELCQYIPDHALLEKSKDYMTADFYEVLDTLFNHLPEHEAMDHEWLYFFVTGNGGTIPVYSVDSVILMDETHATAYVSVRQKWEDGTFDEEAGSEEHQLSMELVNGQWLMSDFDGHKADCIRHIALNRQEQAVREAISDYLVREIAPHYSLGELCVPVLMMVHEADTCVWGDFWVLWYNVSGDTLKTVSGGSHPGRISLRKEDNTVTVTAFEQVEDGARFQPSAQRIFGEHYDLFSQMHSNEQVREAVRKEQLREYVNRNGLSVKYYQDFGWPAVELR